MAMRCREEVLIALDFHATSLLNLAFKLASLRTAAAVSPGCNPLTKQSPLQLSADCGHAARTAHCGEQQRLPEASIGLEAREPPAASAVAQEKQRCRDVRRTRPELSVICFDFTDTLFPTAWVNESMQLGNVSEPLADPEIGEPLQRCAAAAAALLELAVALAGRVLIVAPEPREHFEATMERYVPELRRQIDRLGVRVAYVTSDSCSMGASNVADCGERFSEQSWAFARAGAIARECEKFYSKYADRTWKNVLLIGGSDFDISRSGRPVDKWTWEHRRFAQQLPQLKTIRLFTCPTCRELAAELSALASVVQEVMPYEHSVALDFGDARADFCDDTVAAMLHCVMRGDVEKPSGAVIEGLLWKHCADSGTCEQGKWRRRRVWLSTSGHLWCESPKISKCALLLGGHSIHNALVCFAGDFRLRCSASVADREREGERERCGAESPCSGAAVPLLDSPRPEAGADGGRPLYALRVELRGADGGCLGAVLLATETPASRCAWISSLQLYARRGSKDLACR